MADTGCLRRRSANRADAAAGNRCQTPALTFLVAAAALAGCVSTSQPATTLETPLPIHAQGEFVHGPSGMSFPESIGHFRRVQILRYDEDGRNVSVGYNVLQGTFAMAATVYVYPQPRVASFLAGREAEEEHRARMIARALAGDEAAIRDAHRDDAIVETSRGPVTVRSRGGTHAGERISWDIENALGTPRLRGTTHVYLFPEPGGEWFVKFRFTHLRGAEISRAIQMLFDALVWPGEAAASRDPGGNGTTDPR